MSSETSTDSLAPWQLFTLAGLLGATLVVFLSRGQTPAGIILLSFIIFAAAAVGVAAWRTLSPFTGADAGRNRPVLRGRTRAAIEREKTLVLRAIKELEFDFAMGKVSQKDFDEMRVRLRSRAARLITQLDAGAGYRKEIEREVLRRIGPPEAPPAEPAPSPAAPPPVRPTMHSCPACSLENDIDARFCKHCGASLGARP